MSLSSTKLSCYLSLNILYRTLIYIYYIFDTATGLSQLFSPLVQPLQNTLKPRVALSVVLPPKPYGYDPPNPAPGREMQVWRTKEEFQTLCKVDMKV